LLGHGLEHIFKEFGTEVNCFKKKGAALPICIEEFSTLQ